MRHRKYCSKLVAYVFLFALLNVGFVRSARSAPTQRNLLVSVPLLNSAPDTGLRDAVDGVPLGIGHYLVGDGIKRDTIFDIATHQFGGVKLVDTGTTWSQNILYSGTAPKPDLVETSGLFNGVTLAGANSNQQDLIWMLDAANSLVYKVHVTLSSARLEAASDVVCDTCHTWR